MGGEAGRIWVMEKPGGETARAAEASHPGLGWRGRPLHGDGVRKPHWNYSRRPVCARVCAPRAMCIHTHLRTHAIPAHLRSHLMTDVTPGRRWGPGVCLRRRVGGFQWGQQGQGSFVPLQPHLPTGLGCWAGPIRALELYSALGPMGTRRNLVPALRVSQGRQIINITREVAEH